MVSKVSESFLDVALHHVGTQKLYILPSGSHAKLYKAPHSQWMRQEGANGRQLEFLLKLISSALIPGIQHILFTVSWKYLNHT